MSAPITHSWRPIEDLPANWKDLASSELGEIWPTWREDRETLEDVSDRFMELVAPRGSAKEAPWWSYEAGKALTADEIVELHQVLTVEGSAGYRKGSGDLVLADDSVLEGCPAGEIAAEMDRLLAMHVEHGSMGVPPEVEAAWLHHRLTLIRPFETGNGRVARFVASLAFVRAGGCPLSIGQEDRMHYRRALGGADRGDLTALVRLLAFDQKRTFRRAHELAETVRTSPRLQAIREHLEEERESLADSIEETCKEWGRLRAMGLLLQDMITEVISETLEELQRNTRKTDRSYVIDNESSGGPRSGQFRELVEEAARRLGYSPNLEIYSAWTRIRLMSRPQSEVLLSYHGVGKTEEGVLGASSMFIRRREGGGGQADLVELTLLSDRAFKFHHADETEETLDRFDSWIVESLKRGFQLWAEDHKTP